MTPDPDDRVNDDLDIDLGEPIHELLDFEEPAPARLLGRIVSSLRRRALTSDFATFAWSAMSTAVLEFLAMVFSIFEPRGSNQGETD